MSTGEWYNPAEINRLAAEFLILLESSNGAGVTWEDVHADQPKHKNIRTFRRKFNLAVRSLKFSLEQDGKTVYWNPTKQKYFLVDDPIDAKVGERHSLKHMVSALKTIQSQANSMIIATANDPSKEEHRIAKLFYRGITRTLEDAQDARDLT